MRSQKKKLWAIWCKDKGDYLPAAYEDKETIMAFPSKQAAMRRAAQEYGFDTYTEAKQKDWCEVVLLAYPQMPLPCHLMEPKRLAT